ncbi:hypothetical protein ANN_27027 [Periplaneta americana]|uniref:PiggyBac transposable element-derived protein domain-containing protein n=1 Tax=Periplaneta americana TaxID=6978 RepID=A0ABQ8RWY0_PERAM|nr:hypothetical protein ANN_27027 [Periplaneta americana]
MRSTLSPAFTSSKMRLLFSLVSEIGQQMTSYLDAMLQERQAAILLKMTSFRSKTSNILMAANDDTKLDYHDLWSERFGRPVYLATMSRNRFRELVKVIRFDDKDTREDRRKGDKFAPLREVFELMNEAFLQYYCPGESVVFMKVKPGKYGVLIRILADCKERYVLRMEVYAGKTEDSTPESRSPKSIVKRLATPLKGSGRNITTDRYYTSVELAEELYTDYGLTLVGTMQIKRKHIPEELKTTKNREVYSSKFAFTDPDTGNPPVTLVSYVTHIAAINGYCLYLMNDPSWEKTRTNRHRMYLQELGLKLIERKVQDRAKNVSGLKNNVVITMENILSIKIKPPVADTGDNIAQGTSSAIGKKRCYICWQVSSKEERKNKLSRTTITCSKCHKSVCGRHNKRGEQTDDPTDILPLEMKDLSTKYTNDVIATSAFGIKCDTLANPNNDFYKMGKEFTKVTFLKFLIFTLYSLLPKVMKALGLRMIPKKVSDFFRSLVRNSIKVREKEGIVRPDMIHLLMQVRDNDLRDEPTETSALQTDKKMKEKELVEKKLSTEGCTGRNGEWEKSLVQKKISDDRTTLRYMGHMRRQRGRQKIGKIGESWVCSEIPARGQNTE